MFTMDSLQVIPPPGWSARSTYRNLGDLKISNPICQKVTGKEGVYQLHNLKRKSLTFDEFSWMAESEKLDLTELNLNLCFLLQL